MRRCFSTPAPAFSVFFQRDQNLAVFRADGGDIAESQVQAAVRKADVIHQYVDPFFADHVANHLLDTGEDAFRLLDARAFGRHDVKAHLA